MTPLGVEYGCKFTLTGPDGTIAVFNDSTDPNFVGILSPESSGLDSPDVREDAQDNTEDDGGIHGSFFYGRRPVILQGTIIASSATQRNERVDKLQRASNAMRGDATLKWKPAGATEEVELKLRRQQPVRITKGYVKDFQVPLVSARSYIEGVTTKESGANTATATKSPTAVASVTGTGSVAWTNPTNALTSDNVRATAALSVGASSNWLRATGYGFVLPTGALPKRAVLNPEAQKSAGAGKVTLSTLALIKALAVDAGSTISPAIEMLLGSDTNVTQNAGLGEYTKADVENSGFGYSSAFKAEAAEGTAAVDALPMSVLYSFPIEVENNGDAPADFIAEFKGLGASFGWVELINETTGELLKIETELASLAQTVTVDTKNRTIVHSVNGNIYSTLNFSASTWFKLLPGKTKLVSPNNGVVIKYRNTWV